jgi:acetyl-CoA acyltransferase
MPDAVIIDCLRTPVGTAPRGALRNARPDELAAVAIRALLHRYPQAQEEVEDVILGCAMPEGQGGNNMARGALLRAGLPASVPGITVNRSCSSGLQAIALAAERICAGFAHAIIAGGCESMSLAPPGGLKPAPNPWFVDHWPEVYLTMGLTAERVQRKYGITREDADAFALRSHRQAVAAQEAGRFLHEIVPVELEKSVFEEDEGPRADATLDALAKLKLVHTGGTVTAGNSAPPADGAAAALVMSDTMARRLGLKPRARFVSFAAAGVPPEIMGMGPVVAIPKALALAGLKLEDIAVIELNEAFAVQALAVMRTANLDPERVNPNGGAIALGHPLGATGAKLTAGILRELERREARYGMVTLCAAGGQGAAGIFERIG